MLTLIKPTYLNLVWQQTTEFPSVKTGERLVIGKITEGNNEKEFILEYLKESADYEKYSKQKGNTGLTAFPVRTDNYPPKSVYNHLVDRMPSKKRGDFNLFLQYYGLDKSHAELDDFTLLAYTGSQFSGDGFSLMHPYDKIDNGVILFDIAGSRHYLKELQINAKDLKDKKIFIKAEVDNPHDNNAVAIYLEESEKQIGYIPKGQNKTIFEYLCKNNIHHGFIKRINGFDERPNILVQLDLITIDALHNSNLCLLPL